MFGVNHVLCCLVLSCGWVDGGDGGERWGEVDTYISRGVDGERVGM